MTTTTKKKQAVKGSTKKKPAKKGRAKKPKTPPLPVAPIIAKGSPKKFRARVRMYRHGLGDCFLVTFPRKNKAPFQILIDCGALARDKEFMTGVVKHIRDTVRAGKNDGKAMLDVVVATHEHRDHVSGFNQARDVFNDDFDFGAVWLSWTEDMSKAEIKKFKEAKAKAITKLQNALNSSLAPSLQGLGGLFEFSQDEDTTETGRIANAMEYLKLRGNKAGALRYCEPGEDPFTLDGVAGVRVYVLGPSRDPAFMKMSDVTKQMEKDDVVYHLAASGEAGMDALGAAIPLPAGADSEDKDRYYPFASEHRISVEQLHNATANSYLAEICNFVAATYDNPAQTERRIDDAWLTAFEQLALDLDNDTNNTSLVLAFEFVKTGEVLLFVGDAQVGNWKSWAKVEFNVPGRTKPVPAHDLISRTVFYKVGHHCSHNATLKKGGLELMNRDDLVAFIPLDKATAKSQGSEENEGGKGWKMPAPVLFDALKEKTDDRVAISDVTEVLTSNAKKAGVCSTDSYIDYFLI